METEKQQTGLTFRSFRKYPSDTLDAYLQLDIPNSQHLVLASLYSTIHVWFHEIHQKVKI